MLLVKFTPPVLLRILDWKGVNNVYKGWLTALCCNIGKLAATRLTLQPIIIPTPPGQC